MLHWCPIANSGLNYISQLTPSTLLKHTDGLVQDCCNSSALEIMEHGNHYFFIFWITLLSYQNIKLSTLIIGIKWAQSLALKNYQFWYNSSLIKMVSLIRVKEGNYNGSSWVQDPGSRKLYDTWGHRMWQGDWTEAFRTQGAGALLTPWGWPDHSWPSTTPSTAY